MAIVPLGNTTHRVTVAVLVCKAVVNAFGVPSVTAATVQQNIKSIIWDDMGRNSSVYAADCIATVGAFGTIVLWVMPASLAACAINIPIIPATAELLLMLSCNVIHILIRAFKDCTHQCLGQRLKKDIERAAQAYRRFAKQIHQEIKGLIPKVNIIKVFQVAKIQIGVERILEKYTHLFIEQSDVGASRHGSGHGSEYSLASSLEVDKTQ